MSRLIITAGALALSGLPALAGGFGCVGNCYTPTYVPPTYGTVTEKVVMRAPETYAITTPAQYKTVYDTVQTGGGRYWSVTRDPYTGKMVGCWITKPVSYATVARTVQVSAPQVIPYAVPAVYGYRSHSGADLAGLQGLGARVPTGVLRLRRRLFGRIFGRIRRLRGRLRRRFILRLGFGAAAARRSSHRSGGGFGLGRRLAATGIIAGGGFGGHGHGSSKAFAGGGHRGGGKRHF